MSPALPSECPHRPPCPGCPRFAEPGVAPEAGGQLSRLAAEFDLPAPRVVEGDASGYRHRARLMVRGRAASPKVGIFQSGTHRIVDIPRCQIHHPLVNRAAAALKSALRETGIEPYAETAHRGVLRALQVVVERASQRVQIVLVANAAEPDSVAPLLAPLRGALGERLHSIWWNGNSERTNTILGSDWRRLAGDEATVETIGGARVFFPPGAFGQANLPLADRIVERIARWVPEGARVAELYAGCGAIGLGLLPRVATLGFNEQTEHSLRGLALGLDAAPAALRRRARIAAGPAGECLELLDGADCAIVDPPRRGLDEALLDALRADPPEQIVYASCGVDSFCADARRLCAEGRLRMTDLEAWALFPYTEHVETLARFERRSPN